MEMRWIKYTLNFKRPAGTSRGVMNTKDTYLIELKADGKVGIGECGLLRGLSIDDRSSYEAMLNWLQNHLHLPEAVVFGELVEFPSIQCGLEMALLDLKSENHILFPSRFTEGKDKQPINGLIWMGDIDFMKSQIREKLDSGYKVLKMKIGANDFSSELDLLKQIREIASADELELRVDANGAFAVADARENLKRLAELEIHSIEQPIKAGKWEDMAELCINPPIPIALDEDLIGVFSSSHKRQLLEIVKPQYIILKPSLIGGFKRSEQWIQLAESMNIKWWVTSALESNIGLNAIAQWNYTLNNAMPSGLGTGGLFTNNFESPLSIKNGSLHFDPGISLQYGI